MNELLPEIRIVHHPEDVETPWRVSIGDFMVAQLPNQEKCLDFLAGYIEGWSESQGLETTKGGEILDDSENA